MHVRARNLGVRRSAWTVGALAIAGIVAATGGMLAPANGGAATGAPASATAASAASAGDLGFQVQLGPEQRLIGPTGEVDVPYFSERDANGKLFGVAGTSRTKFWRSANNARISRPRLVLDRGGNGKFDECGVWMMSIQKITRRTWLGFYHAESKGTADNCDHVADTTVWRMGLAKTTNGGKSWFKPGYAQNDNVILTGTNSTATTGSRHAGNGRVVRLGDWYYMFFQQAHGAFAEQPGVYVARARVSDRGTKWKKRYCPPPTLGNPDPPCTWTEPGIGGKATPISRISEKARYVSWNGYLKRWIGFDASGRIGFRLFASEQATDSMPINEALLNWKGSTDIYPLVSNRDDTRVDQWGGHTRDRRSKQLYAYPSILGVTSRPARDKNHSWQSGKTFFVYYMKLFPGDKFNARYLFRRKVTVSKTARAPLNRVELTTYKNRKGKRFSSTEMPKDKSFRRIGASGYLLSNGGRGWKQVFDCTRRGDHALFAGSCKRGWRPYRRVGFIRPKKSGPASVPVYRCVANRRHYVSTSPKCAGGKREARLGFALRRL